MTSSISKRAKRHIELRGKLEEDPFLTDSELANFLGVSVPTIRLDRAYLNIPELKYRMIELATDAQLSEKEVHFGEHVDIKKGLSGISVMLTDKSMCFESSDIVRGSCIYGMAEDLAIKIADEGVKATSVANIKYKEAVKQGTRLVARGEVRLKRNKNYIIWVKTYSEQVEVFSCKLMLNIR